MRSNAARLQNLLKEEKEEKEETNFGECAICKQLIKYGEEAIDAHNDNRGNWSGHIFHKECVMPLCNNDLNNKYKICPICRTPLLCTEIKNNDRNIDTNTKLKGGKKSKMNSKKKIKRVTKKNKKA